MRDRLIKLVAFFVLLYASTVLFPYLVTQESYRNGEPVNSRFPVAVLADGKPEIIGWSEYQRDKALYKGMVFQPDTEQEFAIGEMEKFVVTPEGGNIYRVDSLEDNYRFWSHYSVQGGVVQPMSFRSNGVFSVFYGLFIAATGTCLIGWWRKRCRLQRQRNANKAI